jgi:low affinity Fe/Cu permease
MKALHLKLDELIATINGANNRLIKAEEAPEHVVDELHRAYTELAENVPHPTEPIDINKKPDEEEIHRGP